jgi:hypothetical protein
LGKGDSPATAEHAISVATINTAILKIPARLKSGVEPLVFIPTLYLQKQKEESPGPLYKGEAVNPSFHQYMA